jgi:hypothetical protein
MSSDWEERMQAAAAFVSSVAGTPMFLDESRKQKDKVVSMLTAASVSHNMVPRYLKAVQAGGFAEGHLLEIRAALEAAAERPRHAGGSPQPQKNQFSTSGAAQQNFQSFSMFLKASQWARLRAQGGQEDPLRLLVQFLDALGCRNANELTCRHVAACLLLCTESMDALRAMNSLTFKPMYDAVKKAVKAGLKGVPPFQHLPLTPEALRAEQPAFYAAVYADEGPVACPFGIGDYEFVVSNIRCRGQVPSSAPTIRVATQQPNGLAEVANIMMLGMQQLQSNQQAMMELMGGRPSSEPVGLQRLPSFGGLRRQPALLAPPREDYRMGMATVPSPQTAAAPTLATELAPVSTALALIDAASDAPPATREVSAAAASETPPATADDAQARVDTASAEGAAAPREPNRRIMHKCSGKDAMAAVLLAMGKRTEEKTTAKRSGEAGSALGPLAKRPAAASVACSSTDKPPSFSVEWSRSQIMCRTGRKGPGESFAMPFDENVDKTLAEARAWVAAKKTDFGMD